MGRDKFGQLTFKQLDKNLLKINCRFNVGDTVTFENADSFFHNVYSLSDSKFFDLGSFPKGESRDAVYRSSQMTPWGDELSQEDVLSVILFLKTFRE